MFLVEFSILNSASSRFHMSSGKMSQVLAQSIYSLKSCKIKYLEFSQTFGMNKCLHLFNFRYLYRIKNFSSQLLDNHIGVTFELQLLFKFSASYLAIIRFTGVFLLLKILNTLPKIVLSIWKARGGLHWPLLQFLFCRFRRKQ